MIQYRLEVKPLFRKHNKNSYEYLALIYQFDDTLQEDKVYWQCSKLLRREAKQLGEAQLKDLKSRLNRVGMPILHIGQAHPARPEYIHGMSGRTHTPEARAAISRKLKARWAQGCYKDAKLGRPTDEERKKRKAEHEAQLGAYKAARRAGHLSVKGVRGLVVVDPKHNLVTLKGYTARPVTAAAPFKGRVHTAVAKAKMSIAALAQHAARLKDQPKQRG